MLITNDCSSSVSVLCMFDIVITHSQTDASETASDVTGTHITSDD